jgi:spore coat protein JB
MERGNHLDKDALLKQVTILGFMALDLHLFLNTNPNDKEALAMYNEIVEKAATARSQYEEAFGPLTYGKKAENGWTWMDCPWPWQASFNYSQNHAAQAAHVPDWKKPYGEEYL